MPGSGTPCAGVEAAAGSLAVGDDATIGSACDCAAGFAAAGSDTVWTGDGTATCCLTMSDFIAIGTFGNGATCFAATRRLRR